MAILSFFALRRFPIYTLTKVDFISQCPILHLEPISSEYPTISAVWVDDPQNVSIFAEVTLK
jgi:hypothetical protein